MSVNLHESDFFGWTEHLIEEIEAAWRSGYLAIIEQRRRIAKLLAASPSLQARLDACFLDAHDDVRFGAMRETGLALEVFPEQPGDLGHETV